MPLFLGLDCSTQSLTAVVLDIDGASRTVVFEHTLEFDREFPEYGTTHGVRRNGPEVSSPPLMWAEALERMMAIISREAGLDLGDLRAISGSGQQHGSVYLNQRAAAVWPALDPRRALAKQLDGIFSRIASPVWMDESTRTECRAIDSALGGPEATASLTGSAATERFTGPQIRRFFETDGDGYARTARIHLVSSWLASLLAGTDAPIDHADGSGMNLMDIRTLRWSEAALEATAPGLGDKLPALQPSWTIAGSLATYWRERYGFPPSAVVAWSGDNPCSLIGTGLVRKGRLGVSLGTSDTVFGFSATLPTPSVGSHVFASPAGGYMALLCFRNGSLAREAVRDQHRMDWDAFSRALQSTPAGNGGALMLPWFEPEVTPHVAAGVHRLDLDAADGARNVRAVIEAQMISMANHAERLGHTCDRIITTGGASVNREILQVMADVFGAEVCHAADTNAASLGAALRAYHAYELSQGRERPWEEIVAGLTDAGESGRIAPVPANVAVYRELRKKYAEFEERVIGRALLGLSAPRKAREHHPGHKRNDERRNSGGDRPDNEGEEPHRPNR